MTQMTTEEAFVKVLQMHGIEHAFGIIGSAMMPVSDLFPKAGITFWDCAHECNAGMMGRRLYANIRKHIAGHCPEWSRNHEFCNADQDSLLESFPTSSGHAASSQQNDWPRRVSGSRANGLVSGHGLLPGGVA